SIGSSAMVEIRERVRRPRSRVCHGWRQTRSLGFQSAQCFLDTLRQGLQLGLEFPRVGGDSITKATQRLPHFGDPSRPARSSSMQYVAKLVQRAHRRLMLVQKLNAPRRELGPFDDRLALGLRAADLKQSVAKCLGGRIRADADAAWKQTSELTCPKQPFF